MDLIIKVVICMDSNAFGVELAFNLLQRRVFADGKLILCLLTRDVDGVKEMAAPVEKCCFSNMIELTVTGDCRKAFRDADYLLLTSDNNPEPPERVAAEHVRNLKHVFEKAILFDQFARRDARVLVVGPKPGTWLQIFATVAINLPARNFTGLSRHYVSKALGLIARKLDCQVRDLSGVHVWAENHLDLTGGQKSTVSGKRRNNNTAGLQPANMQISKTQKLTELLPESWIKNYLVPQSKALHWENDRHCVLSAVCHHLADWCRGTAERTVSMVTFVERSERIDDGIYSSCPVTVDNKGNIYVVRDFYTESLLHVKLYRFYENQQKNRFHIRNFLNVTTNINPSTCSG